MRSFSADMTRAGAFARAACIELVVIDAVAPRAIDVARRARRRLARGRPWITPFELHFRARGDDGDDGARGASARAR